MKKKIIIPFRRKSDFSFTIDDLFFKVILKSYCLEILVTDNGFDTEEECKNELV